MALRLLAMSMKQSAAVAPAGARCFSYTEKIGKREVVGYGCNGLPVYIDRVDYPMPAIRFKEDTPEILVVFQAHVVSIVIAKERFFYRLCVKRRRVTGRSCPFMRRKLYIVPPSARLLKNLRLQPESGNFA